MLKAMLNCVPDICFQDDQILHSVISSVQDTDRCQTFVSQIKSGLYLLQISPKEEDALGIRLVDALHILKWRTNLKFVWLTRDPTNSACSYYKNLDMDIESSLRYWYNVNASLFYLHKSMGSCSHLARFEDLLIHHQSAEKVFAFLGIAYHDQYMNYGDFDQDTTSDEAFSLGRPVVDKIDSYPKQCLKEIWQEYCRTPLIRYLKYDRQLLD